MAEERMLITGGQRLEGTVHVSGGKNTSVAVISASILSQTPCVIENLPNIEDVNVSVETLRHLGAKAHLGPRRGRDGSRFQHHQPHGRAAGTLPPHARVLVLHRRAAGRRFGRAQVPLPGGCDIGRRPIDQHIKGMRALGAKVETTRGMVLAEADELTGSDVFMDMVTVGGTINVMLAASRAKGITTIYNAAKEPHIVDLANFLNSMGCRVKGAGTDVIRIRGVDTLQCRRPYAVIPDQIETGTLMIAAAATHGDVTICGCIPTHMEALTAKLLEMGARVGGARRRNPRPLAGRARAVTFKTQVYPGFPTDLQQPMSARSARRPALRPSWKTSLNPPPPSVGDGAQGARLCVFTSRLPSRGRAAAHGAAVEATDLRAGAALVIAGLMAQGTTEIYNTHFIDRGYEHLEEKLNSLGAKISRTTD